mgnify:CR=1 FL=1
MCDFPLNVRAAVSQTNEIDEIVSGFRINCGEKKKDTLKGKSVKKWVESIVSRIKAIRGGPNNGIKMRPGRKQLMRADLWLTSFR